MPKHDRKKHNNDAFSKPDLDNNTNTEFNEKMSRNDNINELDTVSNSNCNNNMNEHSSNNMEENNTIKMDENKNIGDNNNMERNNNVYMVENIHNNTEENNTNNMEDNNNNNMEENDNNNNEENNNNNMEETDHIYIEENDISIIEENSINNNYPEKNTNKDRNIRMTVNKEQKIDIYDDNYNIKDGNDECDSYNAYIYKLSDEVNVFNNIEITDEHSLTKIIDDNTNVHENNIEVDDINILFSEVAANNNTNDCTGLRKLNVETCKKRSCMSNMCVCMSIFLLLPYRIYVYMKKEILCKAIILALTCGFLSLLLWSLGMFTYSWRVNVIKYKDLTNSHTIMTKIGLIYAQRLQILSYDDGCEVYRYDKPLTFKQLMESESCQKNPGSSITKNTTATQHDNLTFVSIRPDAIGVLSVEEEYMRKSLIGNVVWNLECNLLGSLESGGLILWIFGYIVLLLLSLGLISNIISAVYDRLYSNKITHNPVVLKWIQYLCTYSYVFAWIVAVISLSVWGHQTDKAICTLRSGGSAVCGLGSSTICCILSVLCLTLCLVLQCVKRTNKLRFSLRPACTEKQFTILKDESILDHNKIV